MNGYRKLSAKSGNRCEKLIMGLKKLRETAKIVDELNIDAGKK